MSDDNYFRIRSLTADRQSIYLVVVSNSIRVGSSGLYVVVIEDVGEHMSTNGRSYRYFGPYALIHSDHINLFIGNHVLPWSSINQKWFESDRVFINVVLSQFMTYCHIGDKLHFCQNRTDLQLALREHSENMNKCVT